MSTLRVDTLQDRLGTGFTTIAGVARAWVNFNGTGVVAIRAQRNVSSITDGGVGIYTVNFTTAMSDVNYPAVGTQSIRTSTYTGGFGVEAEPSTTSACLVRTYAGGALADLATVSVSIFR